MVPSRVPSHTGVVAGWGDLSYVLGPMIVFIAIGGLALVLRWAYRPGGSLVAKPVRRGASTDYGLLVPVSFPGSYVEGEIIRRRLVDAGVRATLAMTQDGPRVMVFPEEAEPARRVLASPGHKAP